MQQDSKSETLRDKYGREVLRKAPEGWVMMEGCLTQSDGTKWYCNMKTIKSGERKCALVLVNEKEFFEWGGYVQLDVQPDERDPYSS